MALLTVTGLAYITLAEFLAPDWTDATCAGHHGHLLTDYARLRGERASIPAHHTTSWAIYPKPVRSISSPLSTTTSVSEKSTGESASPASPHICCPLPRSLSSHHVAPASVTGRGNGSRGEPTVSAARTWRRRRIKGAAGGYGTICQPRGPFTRRIPGPLPARLLIGRNGPLTLAAAS
ncbi:hypothetical protein JOL62DRAFT_386155 [Phyllosticta paracitricarpa]|uniref:Uncharacterized protein n=1 Tax=Phyllosticta paracitricarpa TaxID=2016321 RepID=A0ABR1NHL7_9PEZI